MVDSNNVESRYLLRPMT